MESNSMDVVLVLGAFAGMLLAFYKIIGAKDMQGSTDRESDRSERKELTEAINLMADSSRAVAESTKTAAEEAKQRNGHLGEQNVQIAELVSRQNNDVSKIRDTNKKIADILSKSALIAAEDRGALLNTGQYIDTQIVHNQEVKKNKNGTINTKGNK